MEVCDATARNQTVCLLRCRKKSLKLPEHPRAERKPLFGNDTIAECYDVLKKAILAG